MGYLTGYDVADGIYDTREVAYHLKMTAYCALFDTSPAYQRTCQSTILNSFPSIWTPHEFPDGSWPQLFHDPTTPGSWGLGGVMLTNGSTAVTAIGTPGWVSLSFPSRIWFLNSTSAFPTNNAAGDPVSYSVTFVDAKHLTLGSPYQGATGAHGWSWPTGRIPPSRAGPRSLS